MAWNTRCGTHSERKEAEAARRSNTKRDAMANALGPPIKPSTRKRPSCGSRKFGIEYKMKDGVECGPWMKKQYRNWRKYYSWYETAAQRDQALDALNKKDDMLEYKAIDR